MGKGKCLFIMWNPYGFNYDISNSLMIIWNDKTHITLQLNNRYAKYEFDLFNITFSTPKFYYKDKVRIICSVYYV